MSWQRLGRSILLSALCAVSVQPVCTAFSLRMVTRKLRQTWCTINQMSYEPALVVCAVGVGLYAAYRFGKSKARTIHNTIMPAPYPGYPPLQFAPQTEHVSRNLGQLTKNHIQTILPLVGIRDWYTYLNYFNAHVAVEQSGVTKATDGTWTIDWTRLTQSLNTKIYNFMQGRSAANSITESLGWWALYEDRAKHIVQLPVFEQGSTQIIEHDGTNCGYHALKNAYYIMRVLQGNKDKTELVKNLTSSEPYSTLLDQWRLIVSGRREAVREATRRDNTWLIFEDMVAIKNSLPEAYNTGISLIEDMPLDKSLSALVEMRDDLSQRQSNLSGRGDHGHAFVIDTKLRNINSFKTVYDTLASADSGAHAFVINLGSQDHYPYACSHWITVVVYKHNGQIYFYVTDSSFNSELNYDTTPHLKAIVDYFSQPSETPIEDV